MIRIGAFIVVLTTLIGCATVTPINRGAGQPAEYLVECNGDVAPWSKCFAKANQVCPRGYDVIEQASDQSPTGAAIGGSASFGVAIHRQLHVRCN